MDDVAIPYCGPAPVPGALWNAWNVDPFVIAGLFGAAALIQFLRTAGGAATAQRYGHIGLLVLAVAFVSPLCALGTALFSARIAHHVLMIAIAAPLLALALPQRRPASAFLVSAAFLLHTLTVWLWHAPSLYAFAVSGVASYWLMELTLLGTALMMWRAILGSRDNAGPALAALLGSIVQMGLLGALLTFARQPLFAPHFATSDAFGLSPLADQQLAGLIMWVPAALPYLAAALVIASGVVKTRLSAPAGRAA